MHKKSKSSSPVHVSNIYKDLLQTLGLEKRYLYDQALRLWGIAVGDYFSSHSRPIRAENGKIFVSVDDPSIRQEIHFKKFAIMSMINKELGKDIIQEIILR